MEIAVKVLLSVGVACVVLSSFAVLFAKDFYDRLHYMAPPATISVVCFTAALIIEQGFNAAAIKAILIAAVLFLMNAVLTHATARAARVRQFGCWEPDVKEVRGNHRVGTAGANSRAEVDEPGEEAA